MPRNWLEKLAVSLSSVVAPSSTKCVCVCSLLQIPPSVQWPINLSLCVWADVTQSNEPLLSFFSATIIGIKFFFPCVATEEEKKMFGGIRSEVVRLFFCSNPFSFFPSIVQRHHCQGSFLLSSSYAKQIKPQREMEASFGFLIQKKKTLYPTMFSVSLFQGEGKKIKRVFHPFFPPFKGRT